MCIGLHTRLNVFVVLSTTIWLVKLNFIFPIFFTVIEFGIGHEHDTHDEGRGEGSCCSCTDQQTTENSKEMQPANLSLKIFRNLRKLDSPWR